MLTVRDFDWDDEDWDWDDKALIESYAAFGIEKSGKSYYYQNELVNIIKDQRPDSSLHYQEHHSECKFQYMTCNYSWVYHQRK